ncbi:MAG: hypothetical protein C4346_14890 [Chloroflexota bacterium]
MLSVNRIFLPLVMICIDNSVLQPTLPHCRWTPGVCAMLLVRVLMVPKERTASRCTERRHNERQQQKGTTEVIRKDDDVIKLR